MSENSISAISTIERALGIIEGVSCGIDNTYAQTLLDALEMIDGALKSLLPDCKLCGKHEEMS